MGVYEYNNMAQLYADCVTSDTVSGIIHMGDHAYNEGESDEHRADGYMSAWQPTLANCLWVPIVGNHEYYDGAELYRFLNQTAGGRVLPQAVRDAIAARAVVVDEVTGAGGSTVVKPPSALGTMLSQGNYLAQGLNTQGAASHTSRFFSVDIGLIHLVALDLNGYYGDDPCGQPCIDAQKAWLAKDLAAANKNRDNVRSIILCARALFSLTPPLFPYLLFSRSPHKNATFVAGSVDRRDVALPVLLHGVLLQKRCGAMVRRRRR
tara:strand:+ start:1474 stop:2265 length:792 start_codon:yes stop_codon:yes gene_type:complete